MINVKELRIGNLIYPFASVNTPVAIKSISDTWGIITTSYTFSHTRMDETNSKKAEPIPLTPEWLERCGFEKKNMLQPDLYTWWKDGMGEYLTFHHDGFCVFEFGNRRIISNLHQLQNLYFALTGEELTINNVNLQTTS